MFEVGLRRVTRLLSSKSRPLPPTESAAQRADPRRPFARF